jgi:cysteine synthase A
MRVTNILETIGNSPLVKINHLYPEGYTVYTKVEKTNPGGSIKDRIALSMVEDAEQKGILKPAAYWSNPHQETQGLDWPWFRQLNGTV